MCRQSSATLSTCVAFFGASAPCLGYSVSEFDRVRKIFEQKGAYDFRRSVSSCELLQLLTFQLRMEMLDAGC